MNETEKKLLQSLLELEQTIRALPTLQPKPSLLPLFQQIEDRARELPPGTDPTLRHYLQKKSYEKARLFLQGCETENQKGNCHHV